MTMVVRNANIHNIMGGMESTGGVRLHNHRRKLKQRFDIIRKLGQGTYGKVQLGINKETGQEVAIKTIKKAKIETEADLVRIRREIQIMSSVQHPNIIHIYEVFENREKMVLVMEYAAGGELYDYLSERKVLAQDEAQRIFRQIASAIYYCHKHKICHRDLKLENILLDEHGSAKIADFGLSNVFNEQRLLNTFCGSPLYASPEIVKGTPYHGPEVDCWSLGVLLYTLVYGAMPFDGSNFKRLVKQISQGDYFEPKVPSPASSLIRDMLTVAPAKRADIEKVCSHWWVNEGYSASCLELAEELANLTPVRLDLLLSLSNPPSGEGTDNILMQEEQVANDVAPVPQSVMPTRCHSVGSLMELDHAPLDHQQGVAIKPAPGDHGAAASSAASSAAAQWDPVKRKLEEGVSTGDARGGARKKERGQKKDTEGSNSLQTHLQPEPNLKQGSGQESMEVEEIPAPQTQDLSLTAFEEPKPSGSIGTKEDLSSNQNDVSSQNKPIEIVTQNKTPTVAEDQIEGAAKSMERSAIKSKEKSRKSVKKKESKVEDVSENVIKKENYSKDIDKSSEKQKKHVASDLETSDSAKKGVINETKEQSSTERKPSENSSKVSSPSGSIKTEQENDEQRKALGKSKTDVSQGKHSSSTDKISGASTPEENPPVTIERRRSKIFETAEKFNSILSGTPESKVSPREKPKKLFIPGVKVSDAKRAFERKLSNPEVSIPGRKFSLKSDDSDRSPSNKESPVQEPLESFIAKAKAQENDNKASPLKSQKSPEVEETTGIDVVIPEAQGLVSPKENKDEMLRNVSDISNIEKLKDDVKIRKSANAGKAAAPIVSENCKEEIVVESGTTGETSGESKTSGQIPFMKSPLAPPLQTTVGSDEVKHPATHVKIPSASKTMTETGSNGDKIAQVTNDNETSIQRNKNSTAVNPEDIPGKKKSSKVEITLKSATLPRRKTSKAEIRLEPKMQPIEFKTEVQHMVDAVPDIMSPKQPNKKQTIVENAPLRSWSLEPESTQQNRASIRECIIPVQIERENKEAANSSTPLGRPPLHPMQQRALSQQQSRSTNLSRQSTQESDTDAMEPIRKSPREYIIPIAMEGGGYITPRAGSLEPSFSEDGKEKQKHVPSVSSNHFRRMSSLLSDTSEDEGFNSASVTLPRHGSLSRDGDDGRMFHFHKLRSSRPFRRSLERNDSLSSAEEDEDDDDDEGFEILTAESLFSTLLSRVRSLTQRLTVEDGKRTGFPTSHLMNQLVNNSQQSPAWKTTFSHHTEPLARRLSETSTFPRLLNRGRDFPGFDQRSLSREPSDHKSIYSESSSGARVFPRGPSRQKHVITGCDNTRRGTRSLSLSHQSNPDFTSGYDLRNKHIDDSSSDKYYTSDESSTRNSGLSVRNFPKVPNIHNSSRQDSNLPRKLTRTMSLRNAEEKSHEHQLHDNAYSPTFMKKNSYNNDLSTSVDYYYPPYRSLRNRNANVLPQRYSSTSDLRESRSKESVSGYVLPPLPQNYKSASRYRDSSIPRALPSTGKLQGLQSNRNNTYNTYSLKETDLKHQPRHSSSLPSIAEGDKNGKGNKPEYKSKSSENQEIISSNNMSKLNENSKQDGLVNTENYGESSNLALATFKGMKPVYKTGSSSANVNPRYLQRSLSQNYENSKTQIPGTHRGTIKSFKYGAGKHLTSNDLSDDKTKETLLDQNTSLCDANDQDDEQKKQKRRISRFLRPDFFDTPPEESSYVKEREAMKAAEAEKKKAKRIARRSALMEANKALVSKIKTESDVELSTNSHDCKSKTTSSNKFNDTSDASVPDLNSLGEKQISLNVHDSKELNHDDQNQFRTSLEKGFKIVGASLGPPISTVKSRVGKAISSLQEHSLVPQNNPTESTYLKRAVSVDDVSLKTHVSPTRSNSRLGKKISSVLGLFSRKESLSPDEQQAENLEIGHKSKCPSRSSTCELTSYDSNECNQLLSNNNSEVKPKGESGLKSNEGKLSNKSKSKSKNELQNVLTSPEKTKTKSGDSKGSFKSKSSANCSKPTKGNKNAEECRNKPKSKSFTNEQRATSQESNPEESTQAKEKKLDSNNSPASSGQLVEQVHLQVKPLEVAQSQSSLPSATIHDQCACSISSKNPNSLSLPKDLDTYFLQSPAASSLNSPADEVESIDSWTVCSDTEACDTSPVPATSEGEGSESVEDRIRRKSFYLRFNDLKKKKPKKSSLLLKQGSNLQYKTSDSQTSLAASKDRDSVTPHKNADYSEAQSANEQTSPDKTSDNTGKEANNVKKKKKSNNAHPSLNKKVTAPALPDISIPPADQNNLLKAADFTLASTSVLSDGKDTTTQNTSNLVSTTSKKDKDELPRVNSPGEKPSS